MSSPPAPRHEAIAEILREEILRGTYEPGERLPAERDLAARLGANRSSVREALRGLEQMGLVSIRHGDGATVQGLDRASLEVVRHLLFLDGAVNRDVLAQVLEFHELLVTGAARLAVERASDDQLARAEAQLATLADPHASPERSLDAVEALFDLIVEASENWVLALARRAVNPLFSGREGRFREVRMRVRPPATLMAPVAREVSRAVAGREPDRAADAIRRLMRLNREHALDELEALQPARSTAPAPSTVPVPNEHAAPNKETSRGH